MKTLAILGATGSIGISTLAVVDLHPEQFDIFALSANTNWQNMLILCQKYQPKFAIMANETAAQQLKEKLTNKTIVLSGIQALNEVVSHEALDIVMAAIVGSAGMSSTLAAIKANKRVLLANKESLVLAGDLMMKALAQSKASLLPVDSEHSAIYQCLESGRGGLKKIQLTASGGPFLETPLEQLALVTPKQACAHPNWSMGKKISIDSATMMNKGLEVIEAYYLFNLKPEQIEVIVHPQSIVHSLIFYKDGSSLAQLGKADMRTAIAYAMSYPKRINSGVADLDLNQYNQLNFLLPDFEKFPCLRLSFEALKLGSSAMGVLNAANEVCVSAFLNKKIGFLDIAKIIEKALNKHHIYPIRQLDDVRENDNQARQITKELIAMLC